MNIPRKRPPPSAVYVLVQYVDGVPNPIISLEGGKPALRTYADEKRARNAAAKAGVDAVKVSFPTRGVPEQTHSLFDIRGELAVSWL